jgi:hypothetical protein
LTSLRNALYHVYKHSGHPEDGLMEDQLLRSNEGFASLEEAIRATRKLFPELHLVVLWGRYSGDVAAMRCRGRLEWTFPVGSRALTRASGGLPVRSISRS